MNKEDKTASLSTMLGNGGAFNVKEKKYTVKPIALQHIDGFMSDNLSLGSQLFNVANKDSKVKVDRWLSGYCLNSEGNPISLEIAMNDGWDIVDLKEFFKKLCDFSG